MSEATHPRKRIVWLGHPFFSRYLEELGWDCVHAPYSPGTLYTWENILELTNGTRPDVLLVADASSPPFALNTESYPCLTVFYSVDSHIHSWHPTYAQGFDVVLATHKEHLPLFCTGRLADWQVWWTPPHTRDSDRPPVPPPAKEWDLVFAGTVNEERAPARYHFLRELKKRFPGLYVTADKFTQVYPKAKLVLNESSHGELNFRVFEALGCGSCLLTPDIGPELNELFIAGKELFVYPPQDIDALLDLVRKLLGDDALRERTASAGLAAVDARHRTSIRAKEFSERLFSLFASGKAEDLVQRRLRIHATVPHDALRLLYLHHAETIGIESLRQQYLEAAIRIRHLDGASA